MQKRGDELLIKLNAFYLVGEEGQVELIKAVYNEGHVKLIVSSAWNVEIKQAFEKSAKLREWYEQASGIALPQKRA